MLIEKIFSVSTHSYQAGLLVTRHCRLLRVSRQERLTHIYLYLAVVLAGMLVGVHAGVELMTGQSMRNVDCLVVADLLHLIPCTGHPVSSWLQLHTDTLQDIYK